MLRCLHQLLSVFVYESSMSFYLFVLNGLVGSLDSFQSRRQNWRINRGWEVAIVQEIPSTFSVNVIRKDCPSISICKPPLI
jgi:hypothetical protein